MSSLFGSNLHSLDFTFKWLDIYWSSWVFIKPWGYNVCALPGDRNLPVTSPLPSLNRKWPLWLLFLSLSLFSLFPSPWPAGRGKQRVDAAWWGSPLPEPHSRCGALLSPYHWPHSPSLSPAPSDEPCFITLLSSRAALCTDRLSEPRWPTSGLWLRFRSHAFVSFKPASAHSVRSTAVGMFPHSVFMCISPLNHSTSKEKCLTGFSWLNLLREFI